MAKNQSSIKVGIELSAYQQFRRELIESINLCNKLEQETSGVTTGVKDLEKQLESVERVISILNTKVSKDGFLSASTAKELQSEFEKMNALANKAERSEGVRLSPKEFKERYNALTNESSIYQTLIKQVNDLNARLEKQLQTQIKIQERLKNAPDTLSSQAQQFLSTYSYDEIYNLVKPGKKGYSESRKAKFSAVGITEDDARAINSYYSSTFTLHKQIDSQLTELKKKIRSITKEIENEKQKIDTILNQGVTTSHNASDIVDTTTKDSSYLMEGLQAAGPGGRVQVADIAKDSPSVFQQASKAILSTRLVMNTLRKIVGEAVRTIQQMDKALTGMTAVTGKTREEVLDLIPTLKKLAQTTSSTMTEVSNLTTEYLRQGRSMNDALVMAEETAKAAKIAEISTTDSLTYMTSAINGFNLSASDAAHVSDVFANVAAKTATDYEQLAVALSKVSAQANLAGLDIEYTTALLAKGIETTQEAPESIGTALKTIIARMRELTDYNKVLEDGTTVNKVERALLSAGIALRNENNEFRELTDVFNELGPKWDSLNTMQQQAIAQAIAGTRQQSRFVAIMQDWARTMETVEMAQNSAGAAGYQYSRMAEGLEATITNLTTSWQGFTTSLVDTEIVISALKWATDFLNSMTEMSGIWKVMVVSVAAVAGYMKVQKMYMDYQESKLMKKYALENQLTETQKAQLPNNKKQLKLAKAELGILEQQYQQWRKITYEQEKAAILSDTTLTKQQKDKKLYQLQRNVAPSSKAFKLDIKSKRSEVTDLQQANKSQLSYKIETLKTSFQILKTNQSNLSTEQANHLVTNQNLFSKIKLLTLNEKNLKIEGDTNGKIKANLLANKQMLTTQLKQGAAIAGIAILIAGIVSAAKDLQKIFNYQEHALKAIQDHSQKIYELNSKSSELTSLIDQYENLYNKVNKTKEEEQQLLDLEKQLQDQYSFLGTGTELINQAKDKNSAYQAKITESQNQMISDTLQAFRQVSKDIDFFENSTFENAFKQKYVMEFETNLEKEVAQAIAQGIMTMEQYNYAKSVGKELVGNLDSQDIANESWNNYYANRSFGDRAANAGRVAGYGTAGSAIGGAAGAAAGLGIGATIASFTAAGATGGSAAGPWGALIGLAVGVTVGAIVGVVKAVKANSQKAADKAMLEQERIMAQYTQEITNFSIKIANTSSGSLEERYNVIKKELDSGKYSESTMEAIEDMFSSVIMVFEDPQLAATYKSAAARLGDAADSFLDNIITILNGYSRNAIGQALSTIDSVLASGGTRGQAAGEIYKQMKDPNSAYYAEGRSLWEESRQGRMDYLEDMLNNKKNKKYIKALAKAEETTVQALKTQWEKELGQLQGETYEASEEYNTTLSKILDTISGSSDLLSLQQALTGVESTTKNLKEMDKALLDGSMSFEQLINLASTLDDEEGLFYDTLQKEGLENIGSFITKRLVEPYDTYLENIDSFIERQQAIINAAGEGEETLRKSAEQNIILAEAYRKEYLTFNKISLEHYMVEQKIADLEKESKNKNIKATEQLIILKKKEYDTEKARMEQYFKDYPKEYELIQKIRNGTISLEEAWRQVGDNENFKKLLENTEFYFESLEAQQEEMVDLYKETLENERDALKKSLDSRKELYEQYFDAIDRESEEDDYETRRSQLQRAISNLSTATDANSLEKLKEYQTELASLEDEYLQEMRETQRDNLLTSIDNQTESIDQYYEERLANEKALWDTITAYSTEKVEEFANAYTAILSGATDVVLSRIGSPTGYSQGGLVNYTGLAMVHGSNSRPEAFLNADQTAMFAQLAQGLRHYYNRTSVNHPEVGTGNESVVIDNINISIDGVLNATNVKETADSFAAALKSSLQRTGLSLNKR